MRADRGLDRFITFVDAAVAIAMTLLVLPLVEVLGRPTRDMDLAAVLTDDAAQFGACLLSFVVIARLWRGHHRLAERVGAYDSAFLLVNLGWVLTVVLLSFATGTMTASSACLSVVSVLICGGRPCAAREPSPNRTFPGHLW